MAKPTKEQIARRLLTTVSIIKDQSEDMSHNYGEHYLQQVFSKSKLEVYWHEFKNAEKVFSKMIDVLMDNQHRFPRR